MIPRSDCDFIDEVAVYGGLTIPHFGHFLLSSLSRHWKNWKETFPGTKIYVHTIESLNTWFSIPHVRLTLTSLGYDLADFVPIDRPMRIRHLIVPAAGFIEQCLAHQVFGETGRTIGDRLLEGHRPDRRSEPVYLSKERLKGGVWTVENEAKFVEPLRAAGVRIVYPETLSLLEQIRIFAEHRTVIGLAGSALHACLFSEGGHRLIGINPTEYLNSNFVILDKVKGNQSSYVNPADGIHRINSAEGFTNTFRLSDPHGLARDILRLVS